MCFLQKKLAEIRNALREGKGWGIKHFQKEKKKGEESKKYIYFNTRYSFKFI